jgi:hypothetical protein
MTTKLPTKAQVDTGIGTDAADAAATAGAPNNRGDAQWRPIASVPKDTPVVLANFTAACLLTGSPHVWSAMYVTKWVDLNGDPAVADGMWCEASYATMNENGQPTHWMLMPAPPPDSGVADRQRALASVSSKLE